MRNEAGRKFSEQLHRNSILGSLRVFSLLMNELANIFNIFGTMFGYLRA